MSKDFFNAVNQNALDEVANFIEQKKLPVDIKDEYGVTALMYAASCDYNELVDWLLKNGANPEESDNEGLTVLWGVNENNANIQIRTSVITAIARKRQHIPLDKDFDFEGLISVLEQRLLTTINSIDKDTIYPFYIPDCSSLKELINTLKPNYFENKLLSAVYKNESNKIIEALICGADIQWLHYSYQKMLYAVEKNGYNEEEFNKDLTQDKYAFLGHLQRVVKLLEDYLKNSHTNKISIVQLRILENVLSKSKIILSQYDYRKTEAYRANSAILFLTMLALESKQYEQINPATNTSIIRDQHDQTVLTLKEIGGQIVRAVKSIATISERTIAFVAMGVTRQGRILVTTNYHAPRVYDLEVLLAADKFKATNASYKRLGVSFSLGKIHAETMLAAIATQLDIEQIFIIDANGHKKQNCVYCANYLFQQGYANEPHFEKIRNYDFPVELQITSVVNYLQHHVLPVNRFQFCGPVQMRRQRQQFGVHRQIFTMLPVEEQAVVLAGSSLLQTSIDFILRYFPNVPSGNDKEDISKMYGEAAKLISHDFPFFKRDKLVNGVMKTVEKPNSRLSLKQDGRIVAADDKSLKSKDPGSPRSSRLAKIANQWLNAGQGTQRVNANNEMNVITLDRVPRAMKR